MGIEQAFTDRALLDVISLLSSRKESGRLKISDGTTRGAFFFDKGKLVDAHMGPFSGYQAVNLAVSVGRARLSFDPSVQSQTSSFKVPGERAILKERFGIETDGPQNVAAEVTSVKQSIADGPAKVPETVVEQPKLRSEPEKQTPIPTTGNDPRTEIFSALPGLTQLRTAGESLWFKFAFSMRRLISSSSPLQKILLLASVIMFVVVFTAVGFASYWSQSPKPETHDLAPPATANTLQAPATAVTTQPEQKLIPTPPTAEQSRISTRLPAVDRKPYPPETSAIRLPEAASQKEALAAAELTPEGTRVSNENQASSRLIRVVVEIEEGRVSEAFIQKPQNGLQAYEATALRLARQRRFSKGPTRRETITVQVTGEP